MKVKKILPKIGLFILPQQISVGPNIFMPVQLLHGKDPMYPINIYSFAIGSALNTGANRASNISAFPPKWIMCGFRASPTSMWHTESCDCSGCCCHSNLNSNPNSYHHYNMQCNTSPKNSLVSNGGQRNADTVYENCNNTALLLYMSKYLQLCVKERETWRARLQVN